MFNVVIWIPFIVLYLVGMTAVIIGITDKKSKKFIVYGILLTLIFVLFALAGTRWGFN